MAEFSNDTVLLEAFKNGDPLSVNIIFERYFRSLCLISENITGDTMAAEDIVAESFVKMYQKRSEFEGLNNLKSFLFVVVRNSSLTFNTTRKRHKLAEEEMIQNERRTVDDDNSLQYEIMRSEILEDIYREIENLPLQCRRISKMIFLEGKSTSVIAKELGISPDTVRVQKARAIKELKNQLFTDPRFVSWFLVLISLSLS